MPLRPDWETIKTTIMETIVRANFKQHPDLAKRLIETDDAELIEGNDWNDTFGGVDIQTGKGENHLGKILMSIREEFRPVDTSGYVDASFMDDILENMFQRNERSE